MLGFSSLVAVPQPPSKKAALYGGPNTVSSFLSCRQQAWHKKEQPTLGSFQGYLTSYLQLSLPSWRDLNSWPTGVGWVRLCG